MKSALLMVIPIALAAAMPTACVYVDQSVKYKAVPNAPDLSPRGAGCTVHIYSEGESVEFPHAVTGKFTMERSMKDVQGEGGAQAALQNMKDAGCKEGVYLIKDLRITPMPMDSKIIYTGRGAVILDKEGNLVGQEELNKKDAGPAAEKDAPATGAEKKTEPDAADADPADEGGEGMPDISGADQASDE
jgi:hypothetical protein